MPRSAILAHYPCQTANYLEKGGYASTVLHCMSGPPGTSESKPPTTSSIGLDLQNDKTIENSPALEISFLETDLENRVIETSF